MTDRAVVVDLSRMEVTIRRGFRNDRTYPLSTHTRPSRSRMLYFLKNHVARTSKGSYAWFTVSTR